MKKQNKQAAAPKEKFVTLAEIEQQRSEFMNTKAFFLRIDGLNSRTEYRKPHHIHEAGYGSFGAAQAGLAAYFTNIGEKHFDAAASALALTEVEFFKHN